jgi:hypothetical protein
MKKRLVILFLTLLLTGLFNINKANAAALTWTDWTSTTQGTITSGSSTINVSLQGVTGNLENGDYYYNNANTGYTNPTGSYAGLVPTDFIREWGTGTVKLTFSNPVTNLYMSLVSVGQPGVPVSYVFNAPFTVISAGSNYWGYDHYTTSGNTFTGYEYNGILKFSGTFSTFEFTINDPENWHGFNIAATPAPEPSSMLLGFLSISGILGLRKRKSK